MQSSVRILLVSLLLLALPASAVDVAILDAPVNEIDKRNDYTNMLLTRILKHTQPKYGPFRIEYAPSYMYRDRLFSELQRGEIAA